MAKGFGFRVGSVWKPLPALSMESGNGSRDYYSSFKGS